jgi:hypothetical protein
MPTPLPLVVVLGDDPCTLVPTGAVLVPAAGTSCNESGALAAGAGGLESAGVLSGRAVAARAGVLACGLIDAM